MACKRCGAPAWVTTTRDLPEARTLRYRKCYHCGRRVQTIELELSSRLIVILLDAGIRLPEPRA